MNFAMLAKNIPEICALKKEPSKLPWVNENLCKEEHNKILDDNNAKYHKTCSNNYDDQKLSRLRSKRCKLTTDATPQKTKRRKPSDDRCKVIECAFCEGKEVDLSKLAVNRRAKFRLHAAAEINVKENEKKPINEHIDYVTAEWRKMAAALGDVNMLNKLHADVRASELFYHLQCLVEFTRQYENLQKTIPAESERDIALKHASLHIQQLFERCPTAVLEVNQIIKDVNDAAQDSCVPQLEHNVSRFTESVLQLNPSITCGKNHKGANIFLLKEDFLKNYTKQNDDKIKHVAKLIRHRIEESFSTSPAKSTSDLKFDQATSIPPELLSLISQITEDRELEKESKLSQSCLSICQIIMYNFKSRRYKYKDSVVETIPASHQRAERENPALQYISFKLYATVRSSTLIKFMNMMGICLPYHRVLQQITLWSKKVLLFYQSEGMVLPPNLRKGVFTIFTKDNIDCNSSSNTSTKHTHSTSLCAFQCLKSVDDGIKRHVPECTDATLTSDLDLPESYTNVQKVYGSKEYGPSKTTNSTAIAKNMFPKFFVDQALRNEVQWAASIFLQLSKNESCKGWSSHHANENRSSLKVSCIKSIFPLLNDVVHTFEMQYHCITIFMACNERLNPGTTTVDCSDQPIYALSKQVQWKHPDLFPLSKYFPLFGGLHIEQGLLICHAHLIAGTGLDEVFTGCNLTTIGLETACADVNHIKKARYSVQLCFCALFSCLKDAYSALGGSGDLFQWAECLADGGNLLIKFWLEILKFEMKFLILVRSIRESNFRLFVSSLEQLIPWFFIFDKTHYLRWLSVHIFDLMTLPSTNPALFKEFDENGNFCLQLSKHKFSKVHPDQGHEQCNKVIKSIKGPIDFVNHVHTAAQKRWETATPEIISYLKKL